MTCILSANPIWIEFINEFQVAPYDSERVELRYLESSTGDTIFTGAHGFDNTPIVTPAGTAYVDTAIYLNGMEQVVIDRSVLTGIFGLPDDTGYIALHSPSPYGLDSMFYPGHATSWRRAPVPPSNCSAAKFHFYGYTWYEYILISDWYIDSTPTLGAPNDDYPGCSVSGHVYDLYNQPLANVRVTALFEEYASWVLPPLPYYACCTTYTEVDGSYCLDSLLPYCYDIMVFIDGYIPDTQDVGRLCCTDPVTNLDFNLQTAVNEGTQRDVVGGFFAYPNPFHSALHITMFDPVERIDIYDVTGKIVQRIDNERMDAYLTVDCQDLPRGIYFVALREKKLKVIKF
jgi:hypothetical protein